MPGCCAAHAAGCSDLSTPDNVNQATQTHLFNLCGAGRPGRGGRGGVTTHIQSSEHPAPPRPAPPRAHNQLLIELRSAGRAARAKTPLTRIVARSLHQPTPRKTCKPSLFQSKFTNSVFEKKIKKIMSSRNS